MIAEGEFDLAAFIRANRAMEHLADVLEQMVDEIEEQQRVDEAVRRFRIVEHDAEAA